MLGFLSVLDASQNYLDRFLLKALLSSEEVSEFFIASVISRFQPFLIGTLTGVFLSYLARVNYEQLRKYFLKLNILIFTTVILTFTIIYYLNPIVLKILYPDYFSVYNDASLLLLANLVFLLVSIEMFLKPILIKFVRLKFILIKEIFFLTAIIGSGYFFISEYKILGYCYTLLIVSFLKILFSYYIIINKSEPLPK